MIDNIIVEKQIKNGIAKVDEVGAELGDLVRRFVAILSFKTKYEMVVDEVSPLWKDLVRFSLCQTEKEVL